MMFLIGQLRDTVEVGRDTQFLEYPAMLTVCLELLSAFSGMERENINRGVGWLFMSIGRRLERAIYLTRQLREITTPLAEQDWPLLECLLEVADSSMTYRPGTTPLCSLWRSWMFSWPMRPIPGRWTFNWPISRISIKSCLGICRVNCRRCGTHWPCCAVSICAS